VTNRQCQDTLNFSIAILQYMIRIGTSISVFRAYLGRPWFRRTSFLKQAVFAPLHQKRCICYAPKMTLEPEFFLCFSGVTFFSGKYGDLKC
jgi:hypothetical protein